MPIVYSKAGVVIRCGDALAELRDMADQSVHCCVSSPPYWNLRSYLNDDLAGKKYELGSEKTPAEFVENLVRVLMEVHRVLRDDGTLWLNLGDSYAQDKKWGGKTGGKHAKGLHGTNGIGRNRTNTGLPGKSLVGIPWRVAFALQDAGWILRNEIIWHKPSAMPESVKDRCTRDHEHIFLLAKSQRYYFDQEAVKIPASPDTHARYARGRSDNHKNADGGPGKQTIAKSFDHMRKPGVNPKSAKNATGSRQNASWSSAVKDVVENRNLRTVWSIPTASFSGSHFAVFPPGLVEPCILAGCQEGGVVLDPFCGSGTVCQVAKELGRKSVAIELNPEYIPLIRKRVEQHVLFGVE